MSDNDQDQGPDVGSADPTDGRDKYKWESSYPPEACAKIRFEAAYIVILILLSLLLIVANWKGMPADIMGATGHGAEVLKRYSYYSFAGLLGGSVFCLKYTYRVVARGYWHMDRRLWRLLSPLTALSLAFVIGALLEASIISVRAPLSGAAIIGFGFLIGYFADAAVAKMHEVAEVLFGASSKRRD